MPAKILVSGSSGLIGAALIPALKSSGYEITCLVRGTASSRDQIQWDPAQPLVPESVSGFDAVVHLAGESIVGRWTEGKKRRIRESRVRYVWLKLLLRRLSGPEC
jgi:NAD dependent epimerase/dehydratase family enzyme